MGARGAGAARRHGRQSLLSRFDLAAVIRQWQVKPADPQALAALSDAQRARSVVIVQDTFTRYFDTEQLATLIELAARMGFQVWLAPLAERQGAACAGLPARVRAGGDPQCDAAGRAGALGCRAGRPRSGDDAHVSAGVPEGDETTDVPKVALPQEWLLQALPEAGTGDGVGGVPTSYRLLPHCTEKTNAPDSGKQWAQVFARRGLRLKVQATGCCGMSGTYGHEARNLATSKTIYAQSWASRGRAGGRRRGAGDRLFVPQPGEADVVEARHPLQALLDHMRAVG